MAAPLPKLSGLRDKSRSAIDVMNTAGIIPGDHIPAVNDQILRAKKVALYRHLVLAVHSAGKRGEQTIK